MLLESGATPDQHDASERAPSARTGRAAVAGGFESTARRKLEDALVASVDAGDAPEDACAAALAAADLS